MSYAVVTITYQRVLHVDLTKEEAFLLQSEELSGALSMAQDAVVDKLYERCAQQPLDEIDLDLGVHDGTVQANVL